MSEPSGQEGLPVITPPNADTERRLLSDGILRTTFTNKDFLEYLIRMSHHAHLNFAESGFTVGNAKGKPALSQFFKAPRIGNYEDARESLSLTDVGYAEHFDENGELRTFLRIHSHPALGSTRYGLIPSDADLKSWESHKLQTPEIIDAIFRRQGNKGFLFMYQDDPTQEHNNYYQGWSGEGGLEGLMQRMRESGIRFEVLEFDVKNGVFHEAELDKLKIFEKKQALTLPTSVMLQS